ncbi:MAG: carboxypeptidase-like regulatory domain-containing protein [Verrucomicrobiota bacterium]
MPAPTFVSRALLPLLRPILLLVGLAGLLRAETPTGTVEGRVFNPAKGQYVERVRLTVTGTTLETFTDADGNYRLAAVPAGPAKVQAFFTGLAPSTTTVTVRANQTVQHDLTMAPLGAKTDDSAVVKLAKFVVSTQEMDSAALAARAAPSRSTWCRSTTSPASRSRTRPRPRRRAPRSPAR